MATAPRSFRRAAKKQEARPTVAFTLDWVADEAEEGEEPEVLRSDVFHATRPTDERLFLVAALIGDEDAVGSEATAVMDIFRDALPEDEFRTLRRRIADPEDSVDMDTVQDVMEWLMEEWAGGFPTQPSAGSSSLPTTSGTNSTGRVRGKGSTRSGSPSTAS